MGFSRKRAQRIRRTVVALLLAVGLFGWWGYDYFTAEQPVIPVPTSQPTPSPKPGDKTAAAVLEALTVKGRAPKADYERSQFGSGWSTWRECDTRNRILARDLEDVRYMDDNCTVESGVLQDPYIGKTIHFTRGPSTSSDVQIDHVVALADAWQKGAQNISRDKRVQFANDDLNLLAADGPANMQKGAGDAATWLPKNKAFRCQYIARQIAVKAKYALWVTAAEKQAMSEVLASCPEQSLPAP